MLERHVRHYGSAPERAAFDGGYASRENLKDAKALGVKHAVFHKKRGMKFEDMTPSAWMYRQLKRFRAGVEAGISYLKRCFGLGLCRWHGLPRFKAYVLSAVFAHNLVRLAGLRPAPTWRVRFAVAADRFGETRGRPLPVSSETVVRSAERARERHPPGTKRDRNLPKSGFFADQRDL